MTLPSNNTIRWSSLLPPSVISFPSSSPMRLAILKAKSSIERLRPSNGLRLAGSWDIIMFKKQDRSGTCDGLGVFANEVRLQMKRIDAAIAE